MSRKAHLTTKPGSCRRRAWFGAAAAWLLSGPVAADGGALAQAVGEIAGGSVPVGMGTRVVGHSRSGPIATPGNVQQVGQAVQRNVINALNKAGQAVQGEILRQTAAQIQTLDASLKSLRELLVQFGAAQRRAHNEDEFGHRARAPAGCSSGALSRAVSESAARSRQAHREARAAIQKHNRSGDSAVDRIDDIAATDPELIDAQSLLSPDEENLEQARKLIAVMTNPVPLEEPDEGLEDTVSGRKVVAVRHLKRARLAVAQDTMAEIQSEGIRSGGELARRVAEMWGELGLPGRPAGMDEQGRISYAGALRALAHARLESGAWATGPEGIASRTTKGVQVDIALMNAALLAIAERTLEYQRRTAWLLAQLVAQQAVHEAQADMERFDAETGLSKKQ